MESRFDRLASLCVREAGKTWPDAIAEVREAVDFLRYYALLAERQFEGQTVLTGPAGEINTLSLHGRGVFACISPWNFPLAIFHRSGVSRSCGRKCRSRQTCGANAAESRPRRFGFFTARGLDPNLLHLLPGAGSVIGAAMTAHPDLAGVAFTGGIETAWAINRTLASRQGPIVPFIAETGGLNGMFVGHDRVARAGRR